MGFAQVLHKALAFSQYVEIWDSNTKLGSIPTLPQRSVLPAAGAWAKLDIWTVLIYGCRRKFGPTKFLEKILGAENPADAFTKHVPREMFQKSMAKAGMVYLSGRPKCAPDTLGLQ